MAIENVAIHVASNASGATVKDASNTYVLNKYLSSLGGYTDANNYSYNSPLVTSISIFTDTSGEITSQGKIEALDVAGYTFDGWYTGTSNKPWTAPYYTLSEASVKISGARSLTATQVKESAVYREDSSGDQGRRKYCVYPKYTVKTYTVTYKPGSSGTGSQQTQTKTHGVALTLKGEIFTRTGYTQTGWATSDGGAQAYALGGSYSSNAAVTLYPVWTANTYTVTYKPGSSGTGSQQTQKKTQGVALTLKGEIFTRTGYTQTGWATSDGGAKTYELGGNYTANAAVTLYPVWTAVPTYTVTFEDDDGTTIKTETVYEGGSANPPPNPTKTGHTFSGWSGSYTNVHADATVTATYTRNEYTVSLHTNGGTINQGEVTGYTYGDGATLPTDVTFEGHAFGGWYAESDFSGNRVYRIAPTDTGNKTFYAKWTSEYTVTFEDHDGTVLKTESVPSGGDATPPGDPVREGYDFDGWDGDYTNVTEDVTVTATYAIKTFTVTFKDFDGTTIGTPQTVNWGASATEPTHPTHSGYAFLGWSRGFSNVTENIEVVAIYSGAANYTIRGRRWQRLYTAAKATPVYAAESEASLAARTICDVPWTETSGNFVSCLTAHPGTAETDEHNLANREYFDAAAICAGHENGMHRVYAQATCYRFALPTSAQGKRMNTLSMVVSGDPYLRDGARIAVLTNDTGVIPTDCTTCRTGNVHAEGVAKRTTSADGARWYGKTDRLQFTPTGGLTLGSFLYVFVILENYAYSRGEYVEGSACIQPNVEIGMAATVGEWTPDGVNLCYEDLSHSYNICRDGILPEVTGDISGVRTITLQRSGDPTTGTLHTSVTDAQSCIGLRAVYAALYEGRLCDVPKSVALASNAREGAGFVVRCDQESVGGSTVKTWQITTAALLVPFAVPVEFRADKVRLDWPNWSGGATAGGRFCVWLKRGTYVADYPADVLKDPAIYDASAKNVNGYELLGTIDATQAQKTSTFALDDQLGGYVATILLTAFVSLDNLNPVSGMTLPQGVATSLDVNAAGSSMSGKGSGWKPDITLLG